MIRVAFILTVFVTAAPLSARDYGQQGTVFAIAEPDLLAQIKARLGHMAKSGALVRINADMKARTLAKVSRPYPVASIKRAETTRHWRFDPSFTLQSDIMDHQGRLIWARGTRVNPLAHVPLRQDLIFLNGDDPIQIRWALHQAKNAKLILVKGAPIELMKAHQRRFYFDQQGKLTGHFGIRAVPARVHAKGDTLLISELSLNSKGEEQY